jgi:hypothetical protein
VKGRQLLLNPTNKGVNSGEGEAVAAETPNKGVNSCEGYHPLIRGFSSNFLTFTCVYPSICGVQQQLPNLHLSLPSYLWGSAATAYPSPEFTTLLVGFSSNCLPFT